MANSVKVKKVNIKLLIKRLLIIFLFIYLLVSLISQQFKFAALKEANAAVDIQLEEAYRERESLEKEFEAIDSEDFIRRTIRERLGYTKPNEKVFVDASK